MAAVRVRHFYQGTAWSVVAATPTAAPLVGYGKTFVCRVRAPRLVSDVGGVQDIDMHGFNKLFRASI